MSWSDPLPVRTRSTGTPCHSASHSRSGWKPSDGPYWSIAGPFVLSAASAASITSSIGKDSLAGTPRVKLMVCIAGVVLARAHSGNGIISKDGGRNARSSRMIAFVAVRREMAALRVGLHREAQVMKHLARLLAAVLVVVAPAVVSAHFRLLEPASWLIENDRGDPQKAGPCGGTNADWGKPSYNVVGKAVGGQKLHLKIQETVYHPGHYRVALAVNSPTGTAARPGNHDRDSERGPWSVSAAIQNPPRIPVLADGLFVHARSRPASLPPLETDIQLPNINCRKCTLQVVQFMAEHAFNNPGGYSYHHCAELQITADSAKPLDQGWPADRRSIGSRERRPGD